MADFTDDEDSVPSSPQDPEQSIRYSMSMLHLPMTRNSPPSPNQERKQAQLRERAAVLKRRNADVKQKVREVRKRQEAYESMTSSNMLMQLAQANERRRRHLEQIRERARTLRTYTMSIHKPRSQSSLETGQIALDDSLKGSLEADSPIRPLLIPLTLPLDADFTRELRKFTDLECKSARVIQRAIRLKRALSNPDTLTIVEGVLNLDKPYKESVDLVIGSSAKALPNLFDCFGLPTPQSRRSYSWFLYSIVLMCDFHESCSTNFSKHPGFNVLVSGSPKNVLTTQLPIILYRCATKIFCELRKILLLPIHLARLPFHISRLTLARYWREYHYYFVLYKLNHRQALREIADQAFDIASTQSRIVKSLEGKMEKSFKQRVRYFAQCSHFLDMWSQPQDIPWASIGISRETLCSEITRLAKPLKKAKETNRHASEMLYDPFLLDDDLHLNSVLSLSRGGETYLVPPNIGTLAWRKYFFDFYLHDLALIARMRCPNVLHTGHRIKSRQQNIICLEEIMQMMNQSPDMSSKPLKNDISFFSSCDEKLRSLFESYFAYCKYIGDPEDLRDTFKNFDQLCSLYNLREIKTVDAAQFRTYLKLFMLLLMQLLLFANVDSTATLSFVVDVENDAPDILFKFNCLYEDLESALSAKWASLCLLRDLKSFLRFENLYQMACVDCFRANLGLDFPQLKFSKFYQFIFLNCRSRSDAYESALWMVCGTHSECKFDKDSTNQYAWKYFSQVLVTFIISDPHLSVAQKFQKHKVKDIKLLSLFSDRLASLRRRIQALLILSCLASMLNLNRTQSVVLMKAINRSENFSSLYHDLEVLKSSLSKFKWTYLIESISKITERWPLLDLFTEKLHDTFLSAGRSLGLFDNNFLHYSNEWLSLYGEVVSFCDTFYVTYYNILNWIYMDLGNPKFFK